jgi:DUF4097 and DUF4098 domain-containing protein YvlB
MKFHTIRTGVLALAIFPALATAEGMIEERRDMAADGTVAVSNVAGLINISTWDQPEVRLVAELGTDQELEITENSQGLRIAVVNTGDGKEFDEANLKLVVPAEASIVAEGVSSDITVEGSRGKSVTAESVSGDVAVAAEVPRVELSSVSGDVEFKGSSMRTTVESVSGDIELEGISGEVSISTVSGDAKLGAGDINRGQFETVSGTMELAFSAPDGGKITVESMNGDVFLYLPEGQEAQFSAQTFSGDIESAWGEVKQESFGPGSHLKHTSGKSGAMVRVESFSGDIRIGHK